MDGYWLRCIDRDGTRHDVMWMQGNAATGEHVQLAKAEGDAVLTPYMLIRITAGAWEAREVDPES